jgi:hypothetical protein
VARFGRPVSCGRSGSRDTRRSILVESGRRNRESERVEGFRLRFNDVGR